MEKGLSEETAVKRRSKSPKQKAAWKELVMLTSDPEWYKDEGKCESHKKLLTILDPFGCSDTKSLTENEKKQRYLDMRPGIEESIVAMLRNSKTNKEMLAVHKVNSNVFVYLRRKYGFKGKDRTKNEKAKRIDKN